jgi:hypothetical protein
MSLVSFHRGLIVAAIVFCLGYGVWELVREAGSPVVGAVFVVLGVGLGVYLSQLDRFLGRRRSRHETPRGSGP